MGSGKLSFGVHGVKRADMIWTVAAYSLGASRILDATPARGCISELTPRVGMRVKEGRRPGAHRRRDAAAPSARHR